MRYVSCRKDFDDVNEFSPTGNQVYFGNLTPEPGELVMLHGYNAQAKNVEDAYRSNKEMARESGIDNPVTGYLWPGLGANWLESLRFHKAQDMADQSSGYLASYLNGQVDKSKPPSVMTHSLGARVALEAILRNKVKVKTLILLGAAVGSNELTTKYLGVKDCVGKILVFWSKRDPVLARAFQLDQLRTALGHSGPTDKTDWIEAIDVSDVVFEHGDYRFVRPMWEKTKQNL